MNDDFDWTQKSGGTPSGDTGPLEDWKGTGEETVKCWFVSFQQADINQEPTSDFTERLRRRPTMANK